MLSNSKAVGLKFYCQGPTSLCCTHQSQLNQKHLIFCLLSRKHNSKTLTDFFFFKERKKERKKARLVDDKDSTDLKKKMFLPFIKLSSGLNKVFLFYLNKSHFFVFLGTHFQTISLGQTRPHETSPQRRKHPWHCFTWPLREPRKYLWHLLCRNDMFLNWNVSMQSPGYHEPTIWKALMPDLVYIHHPL